MTDIAARQLAQRLTPPPGPLQLKQCVVVSVQVGPPKSLTVTIGGSAVNVPGVRYLASYAPVAADVVWAIGSGVDLLVLGPMA